MILRGIGVSPGIAFGASLLLEAPERRIFRLALGPGGEAVEIERLREARRQAAAQLRVLRERLARDLGETYASIFDAHLLLLDDPSLMGEVEERIREEQVNADWALRQVTRKFLERLRGLPDPYLRERGSDLEDVHDRLQGLLAGSPQGHDLSELEEDTVIVAPSLSPSDAAFLDHERVVAFVTDGGGRTSHTAILANALAVPAVVGLHDASRRVSTGQSLVVDGSAGLVEIDPGEEEHRRYRQAQAAYLRHAQEREERGGPTSTADGERVILQANIEFPEEMESVRRSGAEGVGLYRSEFLFLTHSPGLPDEAAHEEAYRRIAREARPAPVTIRTLDLGGEKYFHKVLAVGEANPVLGLRGVRLCLHRPDIFHVQLRGLLRAAEEGNIRIMFPLISGIEELREVKAQIEAVREALRREGHAPPEGLETGMMVEVPAAAAIADLLAGEVDFLSIGTNDLIQYTLAIDRSNESVAYLYQPLHPAILRMIRDTVEAARAAGTRVEVCGEMASDPLGTVALLGLGLRSFSLNPARLPVTRDLIRALSAREAAEAVGEALALREAAEIEAHLQSRFGKLIAESLNASA
jgi:phosphotransferase system enzyme I (PtsI)